MKSQKGRKDRDIGPDFHVLLLADRLVCVFSVRTREEKGCVYRTTPARQKGTAVLSPRGLGRNTESPQGAKRSETKFTPEGVPVKIYTRVSLQTKEVAASAGPQIATL